MFTVKIHAICIKSAPKQPQIITQSASNSGVICVKMQCMMNGVAQQGDKNGVIEAIKWPRTNGEIESSFLFGGTMKC